ncbi:MAG: hypothetical protein AAE983_03140 [Thermoplasmataceae archaeon]|jgi:hypothetical protein
MPKITFNYYGGKRVGLLIVGIFAITGLFLSFLIPKVIYPAESNSAYASHVQLLLPILEVIFFVIGITLSIKVRNGSNPKVIERKTGHYSTVNLRDITGNQNVNLDENDKIQFLESRIEHYRELSESDPSELPELAKRLVTLSILYKEIDENKSKSYLKESKSVVDQENYPNNDKGKDVSNFVNRIQY